MASLRTTPKTLTCKLQTATDRLKLLSNLDVLQRPNSSKTKNGQICSFLGKHSRGSGFAGLRAGKRAAGRLFSNRSGQIGAARRAGLRRSESGPVSKPADHPCHQRDGGMGAALDLKEQLIRCRASDRSTRCRKAGLAAPDQPARLDATFLYEGAVFAGTARSATTAVAINSSATPATHAGPAG